MPIVGNPDLVAYNSGTVKDKMEAVSEANMIIRAKIPECCDIIEGADYSLPMIWVNGAKAADMDILALFFENGLIGHITVNSLNDVMFLSENIRNELCGAIKGQLPVEIFVYSIKLDLGR